MTVRHFYIYRLWCMLHAYGVWYCLQILDLIKSKRINWYSLWCCMIMLGKEIDQIKDLKNA